MKLIVPTPDVLVTYIMVQSLITFRVRDASWGIGRVAIRIPEIWSQLDCIVVKMAGSHVADCVVRGPDPNKAA